MSILIEGMEMPIDCRHCPLLEGDDLDGLCHGANRWLDDEYFCWGLYAEGDIDESKPLNCPLEKVEPVKTGKWIEATNDDPCYYYCSECHWLSDIKTPYCPNCGARMGENDE